MNAQYFERILDLELLSQCEERELARRWRCIGDQAARNALIEAHLRLVPPVARRYLRPRGSLSELVAEGNFGLLRAAAKFDPERGYRFATYAKYWIHACVSECAHRSSGAALKQPRSLRKVRREYNRAVSLVGDGPHVRGLMAERLQMRVTEIDQLTMLLNMRSVSFEALHSDWHADLPLRAQEDNPEQAFLRKSQRLSLEGAVRGALLPLTARERRIVDERLMADPDAVCTLQDLGREFGVSRERVRQLELNVKRKLLTRLKATGIGVATRNPSAAA